jgi:hypothetical protein
MPSFAGQPETTDQVYGVIPPVAARPLEYACPKFPAGDGDEVVRVSGFNPTILTLCDSVEIAPRASVTFTTRLNAPTVVGVPASRPPEDNVRPSPDSFSLGREAQHGFR